MADEQRELVLLLRIPTYGKPKQMQRTAGGIPRRLQVEVSKDAEVFTIDEDDLARVESSPDYKLVEPINFWEE